jgi:hypothetical protein
MALKRYKLKPHAAPFARPEPGGAPMLKFRIRFGIPISGGRTRVAVKEKCPLVGLRLNEIIQTGNEVAQFFIEHFTAPNNTKRGGVAREGGLLFEDVTATEPDFDLNLDPLLPTS